MKDLPRPPTIYDVARAARVSHQTVSRHLSGFRGIRPETRRRVVAAIAELGYQPNLNARGLTTGRSHRIAALTHHISEVGPSRVLEAATSAAREEGYLLDVLTIDARDLSHITDSLNVMLRRDAAGVLALASTDEMAAAFETAALPIPIWIDGQRSASGGARGVEPTNYDVLLTYLAGLGHRSVIHLAGPVGWLVARARAEEYGSAIKKVGLESLGVFHGDWSARAGYETVMGLADPLAATAIVAANDQIALGAMLALSDRGCRVPDDVSVTGVDDIPEAAFFNPPLTTLRVDFASEGRAAIDQIVARIEGAEPPPETVPNLELVVRRSTGPAPRAAQ